MAELIKTPAQETKPANTTVKREDGREEAWFGCGWRNW